MSGLRIGSLCSGYGGLDHAVEEVFGAATAWVSDIDKGNPQLSPRFVEWMQGCDEGWVTDVPGITRNEALKALGNGVVKQQATAALRTMLAWEAVA